MNLNAKYYLPVILLICGLIFFTNLEVIYVNIMEARNFITAREMLNYNNWIHTTMNLEPRYEKPPLPTWLTAISASLFGLKSLFGLRLPAALSASFLVIISFAFSKKLFSEKQAFITALILATSFYIVFSGRNGQWDIFAHSFMLFSIYKFYQAFESLHNNWKDWTLAGLFLGLSFMSKGPVSFYALLLPFLFAYGLTYKFKGFSKKIVPLLGALLVFAVFGLSWGIYIYLTDLGSAQAIADKETLAWSNRNVRPFYYYWSFFTQSGMWTFFAFVALLYPFMIKRVKNIKAYKFSFLWTIFAVILLSLIPEKKSRYLLPVLIPLALNTGFYIHYLLSEEEKVKKIDRIISAFGFGLLGLICLAFPFVFYFFFNGQLEGLWAAYILCSVTLFALGIFIIVNLYLQRRELVFYASITMIACVLAFGLPLAQVFYNNESFQNISQLRQDVQVAGLELYGFYEITPELIWELGEPVKIVEEVRELPGENTFGLLATLDLPEELAEKYHLKPLDTFDINYISPLKKGYKNRLTCKLYIASKK